MSRTSLRRQAPILAMVGLFACLLVALQLGNSEPGLLYLAPALLLLVPLAFGRYPGERLLVAVSRPRSRARLAGSTAKAARSLASPRSSPRGGVLLALALAGRGPPG